jgi:hypothetical protein
MLEALTEGIFSHTLPFELGFRRSVAAFSHWLRNADAIMSSETESRF